ncbi:hypothetical protein MCP1_90003 [Candidatus Terasakiella magnetica]|nr:hypothetical protein MCP1_90003 [Candidatus Terasakiella magnetica]
MLGAQWSYRRLAVACRAYVLWERITSLFSY